jgi:hypothetical protein
MNQPEFAVTIQEAVRIGVISGLAVILRAMKIIASPEEEQGLITLEFIFPKHEVSKSREKTLQVLRSMGSEPERKAFGEHYSVKIKDTAQNRTSVAQLMGRERLN